MVRFAFLALVFFVLPVFADHNVDTVLCQVDQVKIAATYHFDSKILNVEITKNGQTQSMIGVSYQVFSGADVQADDTLSGLAQFSHINLTDIDSAAGFLIVQSAQGDFLLVKYIDRQGKILGISGINGMNAFICR